jgi:hypothetical protein
MSDDTVIPDDVLEAAYQADIATSRESPDVEQAYARVIARWAREVALREAADMIKAEIERLEVVKGTYAKAQRHALGLVWAQLRSAALRSGTADTNPKGDPE